MNRYETIIISDPDLSDDERTSLFERLTPLIPQHDGFLVAVDEWGIKNLAYEINKKARGYYVRLDYCGTGDLVDELERLSKIDDRILKYMTVRQDKAVDTERIKEEIAQAEAERAKLEMMADNQDDETASDPVPPEPHVSEEVDSKNTPTDTNHEEP